jgi:hypothetical protein
MQLLMVWLSFECVNSVFNTVQSRNSGLPPIGDYPGNSNLKQIHPVGDNNDVTQASMAAPE